MWLSFLSLVLCVFRESEAARLSSFEDFPSLAFNVNSIGTVVINLDRANAPQTCNFLAGVAAAGAIGRVHRAEPVPAAGDGPPYALVQATITAEGLSQLPHEGSLPVNRGAVVTMSGTNEIIISLAEHRGWEGSMTVFGHLGEESLRLVEAIERLPIHNYVHPTYGTVMSMLNTPLGLTLAPSLKVESPPRPKLVAQVPVPSRPPAPPAPRAQDGQQPVFRKQPQVDEAQQLASQDNSQWQTFYDEGVPYYFNVQTKETVWQKS